MIKSLSKVIIRTTDTVSSHLSRQFLVSQNSLTFVPCLCWLSTDSPQCCSEFQDRRTVSRGILYYCRSQLLTQSVFGEYQQEPLLMMFYEWLDFCIENNNLHNCLKLSGDETSVNMICSIGAKEIQPSCAWNQHISIRKDIQQYLLLKTNRIITAKWARKVVLSIYPTLKFEE